MWDLVHQQERDLYFSIVLIMVNNGKYRDSLFVYSTTELGNGQATRLSREAAAKSSAAVADFIIILFGKLYSEDTPNVSHQINK